ncbi:DNA cytosine methyltransferase [Streptomyces sp. NPDC087866]|uniref:DNA cytosine methyltransferase n=1 Tax=Streptomyces sp. NPDC087866 TaxID=3365815 RepID=UPI003819BF26
MAASRDLIVEGFHGPGGWAEGRRILGLDTRSIGMEWDAAACATAAAAGHTVIRCDVAQYPTSPFTGRRIIKVDSSPCQAWSRAGKGLGLEDQPLVHQAVEDLAHGRDTRASLLTACKDQRSLLAAEPMRWHHNLRPETVLMEQVPAVLPLFQQYGRILRGWGYSVWVGILNAADYGVPQTRRRAILIASRVRDVAAPDPTHAEQPADDLFGARRKPWVSMADTLGLPGGLVVNTRGDRKTSGGNNFPADGPSWALTEKARSWWVLRQGARSNASVRRLDQPAATIVAGHSRRDYQWQTVGDGPQQRRQLALAEAAVLQAFGAQYPFRGSESKAFQQIANAVPPLLAAHVQSAATGIPMPAHAGLAAAA